MPILPFLDSSEETGMAITSKLFNIASIKSKSRFWDKSKIYLKKHKDLKTEIKKWADLAVSFSNSKEATEQRFKSEFLDFFFGKLFDYSSESTPRSFSGKKVFDFKKETKSTTDRKKPDATLGLFVRNQRKVNVRGVVEIKGFEIRNLDARANKDVSPVAQAYEYQSKFPGCEWVIVSNMDQFRLYHVIQGTTSYLSFSMNDLLDENNFLLVAYIFARENMISPDGPYHCLSYHNIEVDWDSEKAAIDALFPKYEGAKQKLLSFFEKKKVDNPLQLTQRLLNRFLFINIACSKELVPKHVANRIEEILSDSKNPYPEIQEVFKQLDTGDKKNGLEKYNGGLFKHQVELDDQNIPADILRPIAELGKINYSEEELNTEILGKVFQKSLANTVLDYVDADEDGDETSIGEKTGAVYTSYFVAQAMSMIAFNEIPAKSKKQILNTKVLDPCCGSGTFIFAVLNQFRNYLIRQGCQVNRKQIQNILDKNIVAVDINEAAVEITKLSLYLDLADKILPLPDCKEGKIFATDTLKFESNSKFDIIIGNPPYVRNTELKTDYKEYLEDTFGVNKKPKDFEGQFQYDIYMSFFEKAEKLLEDNGVLIFICSNKFLFKDYGIKLRELMTKNLILEKAFDVSQMDLFKGVSVYPYIFVCRKRAAKANDTLTYYSGIKRIQDLTNVESNGVSKTIFNLKDAVANPDYWLIYNYDLSISNRIQKNLSPLKVNFPRGVAKSKLNSKAGYSFITSKSIAGAFIDREVAPVYDYNSAQTAAAKSEEFGKPLIVFPRTVPRKLIATMTTAGDHIFDRVYYFDPEEVGDVASQALLLPYFNSTIATYHYSNKYGKDQISGGYWDLSGSNLKYLFNLKADSMTKAKINGILKAFENLRSLDFQCLRARAKFVKKYKLSETDLCTFSFQSISSAFYLEKKIGKSLNRTDYLELVKIHSNYKSALFKLDTLIGKEIGLTTKQIKVIHDTVMRDVVEPRSVHVSRQIEDADKKEAA